MTRASLVHIADAVIRGATAFALATALVVTTGPVSVALAAPGNDNFSSATDIATVFGSGTYSDSVDTLLATREAAESPSLSSCGAFPSSANTHSAWYRFQAPVGGGSLTLDTRNSTPAGYDTVLEVWTSGATPAPGIPSLLTPSAACNDDAGKLSNKSEATLQLVPNDYYYVMVRDYGADDAGGNLTFRAFYSATHQIYVNPTTGDDSSNTGSQTLPFKTIQKGVNQISSSGTVNLAPGTYPESVIIDKTLTLADYGGAGARTANAITLSSMANVTLSGTVSAPAVLVIYAASIQQGLSLVLPGGTVTATEGAYPEQLSINKSLTLQGQNTPFRAAIAPGAGNTAITVNSGTVTIRYFDIQSNATGVLVNGGAVTLLRNNFTGSTAFAVNSAGSAVTATQNWWGNASGPTHASNPGGTGVAVSDNVTFSPWCTTALPTCDPQTGIAAQLVFTSSPNTSRVNTVFGTQPVVEVRDSVGNPVLGYSGPVTLTITSGTGTAGASVVGTATVNAVSGVATFSGLSIDRVGQNYQLTASVAGVPSADSAAFHITADRLTFTTSPGNARANQVFPTQPVVKATDQFGNVDTIFTGPVTLAIASGPGGAILSGATAVTATNGVATFSGLALDRIGDYTLEASASGLAVTGSAVFHIGADRLEFQTSPGDTAAGATLTPNPVVRAVDGFGAVDPQFTASVSVALTGGTVGAVLGGTTSLSAVNGVITYTNLSVNLAGLSYQLVASSTGLTGATSTAFDITSGVANQLAFSQQPPDSRANQTFTTVVRALDDQGNLASGFSGPVTITVASGPGTLGGATTVNAVGGVITYTALSLNRIGAHTLQASAPGLTSTTSTSFYISADRLAFVTQPPDSTAGVNFTTSVQATDGFGTLDAQFNGSVAISQASGPVGATLSGSNPLTATNGLVTFTLSLDKAGLYTLQAASNPLTPATSNSFTISPAAASQLVFNAQPGDAQAGATLPPPPVVYALDSFGNLAASFSGAVTMTIASGPGGAALNGTTTVNAVGGVITYTNLSIDVAGMYTVQATASGLTAATSNSFNITPGAAARLVFTAQPGDARANQAFPAQPVVVVQDSFSNTVTSFNSAVTITVASGPGTLGGATTVNAVNGVVTFSGLTLNRIGAHTLQASRAGLTSATSNSFYISADRLAYVTQPPDSTAGVNFITSLKATDSFGTVDAQFNGSVTISQASGPGGATLSGTNPLNAVSGLVTFTLSLDKAGTYTLQAVSSPLTSTTSNSFIISPAAATHLAFTSQPGGSTVNAALSAAPVVAVMDTFNNIVTAYSGSITLTIATGPGGAVLTGTTTLAASGGLATFNGLSLNKAGTYTLQASSDPLTPATSNSFVIGKATATVTLGSLSQTYDGTAKSATATTNPLSLTVVFTYSPATPLNAGSYVVTGTVSDADYQGSATGTLVIAKANQTIDFPGPLPDRYVSDLPFTVAAASSKKLTVMFFTTGQCTASGSTITLTGVGSCTVLASQSGDNNYNPAPPPTPPSWTFNINAATQTITFQSIPDHVLTDPPFPITATTAPTAQPVTFTSSPGICSVAGSTITLLSTGTCTITATSPAAFPAIRSFNITVPINRVYLPLVLRNFSPQPDLAGAFSLSPANPTAGQPVLITVVITNQGSAATTSGFWVDFYINPNPAPNASNQPWNGRCGMMPCYGIAWYVPMTLAPGQSVTLTSTPNGYCQGSPSASNPQGYCSPNTVWPTGAFAGGTNNLYLYVDSWNPGVANGAVTESDENNNLFARTNLGPLDAGLESMNANPSVEPFVINLPDRSAPSENSEAQP